MIYEDLKTIEYGRAWDYQQQLFAEALACKDKGIRPENHLLFCEHPHTITIGKHGKQENLLFQETYLKEKGVSLFQIDRGGDITYHGPGQLVGYPIFDLEFYSIGLRQYIFNVEEIIIRLLRTYDIRSERLDGAAGVWLDTTTPSKTRKIAAIGVRSSRFVTMHGFALNVNTDLSFFSLINPCGFIDKGVTSMEKELGYKVDMEEVKEKAKNLFEAIFIEKVV
ncbi:MAG: lipoyl(octanoyl) transferase LipB [Dysgonomonas sp.]|jgi:lipoyl(octanoyl) transferase|uniref:lipoyl(octanoyl) transferase LipB n=1 Tax=unclassified Dysgonomonas TaxID=2630389 RepID=UPI0025C26B4D|nr:MULTISPECIES: lipoyl(octanoyl) transferase LipB [unclassified Dysgonomonas]MDR2001919.1 lipoyl(octanoyl) transferase LipB [Prevotella sp.]HMM02542.1 lipoyl(octanoyl) transferase LipB [Dysgonomonas sp.]